MVRLTTKTKCHFSANMWMFRGTAVKQSRHTKVPQCGNHCLNPSPTLYVVWRHSEDWGVRRKMWDAVLCRQWRAERGKTRRWILASTGSPYVGGHSVITKISIERQLWLGQWGIQSRGFCGVWPVRPSRRRLRSLLTYILSNKSQSVDWTKCSLTFYPIDTKRWPESSAYLPFTQYPS